MSPIRFGAVHPMYYDVEAMTTASKKAAQKAANGMLADYKKTTRTWSHKPVFETAIVDNGRNYAVIVGTDDEVYRYVDKGTRPHVIRPRRARRLAFRTGYRAKTRRGQLGSTAGGASGPRVFRRYVKHPGTEARDFSETISKRWKNPSFRLIQEAITDAAKRLVRK